jgi:hypothetical protein
MNHILTLNINIYAYMKDYDASSEKVTTVEGGKIEKFEVGMMLDTFCIVNKCWYEAKVVKVGSSSSSSNEKMMTMTDASSPALTSSRGRALTSPSSGKNQESSSSGSHSHANQVQIHFKGWGKNADEWIDMDSDRLSPYRLHT